MIIDWKGCNTILTSASLVRNRFDETKIDEDLKVGVPPMILYFLFCYDIAHILKSVITD